MQGGPAALSILYVGGPMVAVSIVHAIAPRRWSWWVASIGVALMVAIALSGFFDGRSRTGDAVERLSREPGWRSADLDGLRERGNLEAQRPLQFAGVLILACAVPLAIGVLRKKRAK